MSTTVKGSTPGQRSDPQNPKEQHRAELDAQKEPDYVQKAPPNSGAGKLTSDQPSVPAPGSDQVTYNAAATGGEIKKPAGAAKAKTEYDSVVEGRLGDKEEKVGGPTG